MAFCKIPLIKLLYHLKKWFKWLYILCILILIAYLTFSVLVLFFKVKIDFTNSEKIVFFSDKNIIFTEDGEIGKNENKNVFSKKSLIFWVPFFVIFGSDILMIITMIFFFNKVWIENKFDSKLIYFNFFFIIAITASSFYIWGIYFHDLKDFKIFSELLCVNDELN